MSVSSRPTEPSGADRFKVLYQLLDALSRAKELDEVYEAALRSLFGATAADRAAILLFDDDGVLRFKESRGLSDRYQAAVAGHSPWTRGTRDATTVVVPDVLVDESLAAYRQALKEEGIRALVFVPLSLDAGVFGKFMLYYDEPHECSADELEMSIAIATHVSLATARKRAELDCLHSEQRLQAILDNSATVIFLKDLQGRYLLVNRCFEELFHRSKAYLLGRTDSDLFPAETAEQFRAHDQAVLAAGKPLSVEENVEQDDGIHSYISVKFPLEGLDGRVTGVCGIATDITERKQLEAASRHLAAIVEDSDDAIISKDQNGIITSWNHAAERIFGYTAAEVIGKPISILAPQDRLDEMAQILAKIRRGQRIEHMEARRRRRDGQVIDVALTISPVRSASGQIDGVSEIARDISDQKRFEQERALLILREQEALRTSELLQEVAPRLAAQLDSDKLVQEVTIIGTILIEAEFGAFFRSAPNENGEAHILYALSGLPNDTFEAYSMPLNRAFFEPVIRGEGAVRFDDVTEDPRYENGLQHHGVPRGAEPVHSCLAAPVISRSGEVLGGLIFGHSAPGKFTSAHEAIIAGIAAQAAIAMDNAHLFERAQWVQGELKRSNEELRRANQDLETFAYSASHDLQEPLRTISISAEIIERTCGEKLAGRDAECLGTILTASRRMITLIEDLLAYTKATKHEDGPAPTVDSGAVLANVLDALRGTIEDAGAVVTAGDLPRVAIHESRLQQVFQNLISNSIKYCRRDAPRIDITATRTDGWCVFSVVDNGIGIDPRYAEQIFGLFKRLHPRAEYPGSGIGLAICQRVVEQYGGRIPYLA